MKKNIFLIIIFFLLFYSCFLPKKNVSASKDNQTNIILKNLQDKIGPDFQYSLDRNTGKTTSISNKDNTLPLNLEGIDKNDAVSISNQFMKEYGSFFGIADTEKEISLFKKDVDSLGITNIRYGQKYNDVPVFGGQIIVHLGKDKNVNSANGKIIPNISLDTSAKISEQEAIEKSKELWKEQKRPDDPETLKTNLYIFNKSLFQNKPDDTKNYLVWRVELRKGQPKINREYYFIDARSGDLVYQITGIQKAIDRRIYDCSYGDFNCYLDTTDPFPPNYTYGRSEGQPLRGPQPYLGLSDTDNLYSIAGSTHNYYTTKFSRNGGNNLGGIGDGIDSPYAKTDGFTFIGSAGYPSCPNAFFSGYDINFCQGWTTNDIVGHEYAHAVNYFSVLNGGNPAGLTYSGQPGALNESNSDIFGEALEYYIDGSSDWLIGEDIITGGMRSMQNPGSLSEDGVGPYPNKFHDSNYYCGTADNSGVHLNSSVPNHAAYLMAIGGTYNGCAITGIGRTKEEAIFYRAQTVYYTPSTDFNEAYNNLISACGDLYGGTDSSDCKNVKKALQSVEMNQSGYCSGLPEATPECATTVATPTATPDGGTYSSAQTVTLSTTTSGASIYYTTDGTTPTTSSTLYASAITVSTSQTIKAIATKSVMINSAVMSETYVIKVATPTATPAGGTYSSDQSVTLSSTTSGASIYYTTNGDTPTSGSTLYSGSITVSVSETIKAIAIKSGMFDSDVMSEAYTIMPSNSIYRFWSNAKQGHFFTISAAEKDNIIANDPSWAYEGVAYSAFSENSSGVTPVYRFWSNSKQHHFFTVSASEKDSIIANDLSWAYEGIAYYAYATEQSSSTPVYRFWSNTKQGHFFTISATEKDSIIANDHSWAYEGVAYYVPTD